MKRGRGRPKRTPEVAEPSGEVQCIVIVDDDFHTGRINECVIHACLTSN